MQPTYAHSRTRTTSSNIFPIQIPSQPPMHLQQPPPGHARRSPSVNTFSTVSSTGMPPPPAAYRTSPTTDSIRRSTSTRSGSISHNSSYVALLRKQKATVWCDRSQHEDPQLLARQRAAKMRANKDIVGTGGGYSPSGTLSARTGTGLSSAGGKVAAKIRHHGKPGVVGYSPGENYIGVGGVPLRLSATEVEGEDSDEEAMNDLAAQMQQQRLHHRRTGSSGRSSTTSARKAAAYRTSGGGAGVPGTGSLGGRRWSPGDTPERADSLAEDQQPHDMVGGQDDAASGKARSTASGSSAERADNVPDMGGAARLPTNSAYHAAITREKSVKTVEELKRRGSVDERTMTMSAGRLFIANPD